MPTTLQAVSVHVDGAHGELLHPTSLTVRSGSLVVVSGEPGQGHTALSLALAGQIHLTGGSVLIDDVHDPARLRRVVALVDTPGVSEPEGSLPLNLVMAEELAMAHRPAGRAAVRALLAEHGAATYAKTRWDYTPAVLRTALLMATAAARPQTAFIVLTSPDRWGGSPQEWLDVARPWAERGYGVVLQCSEHLATAMTGPVARLGSLTQPLDAAFEPEPRPTEPPAPPGPVPSARGELRPHAEEPALTCAPPQATRKLR